MTLWLLPLLPSAAGLAIWAAGSGRGRAVVGGAGAAALAATLGLAAWAAAALPAATFRWGPLLTLSLEVDAAVRIAALLVPAVALPVVVWAAAHEEERGLARLVGLLVLFAGAMELLVLAADLLTLAIAWEAVGAISFGLIAHEWREQASTAGATWSYNAVRTGGLGLFLAAGAALAATGSFAFDDLGAAAASPWGHLLAAGIVLAAVSKSGQGPFAPWLFRAMEGPTSASALLHSSTMVAAGAWILIRLHAPLAEVAWVGPTLIAVGLATALAGGVVASFSPHAKRLLAASTSAQYGFMLAAAGAGFAGAGLAHLVTHAFLKSLLFLAAGTAMGAAGSGMLRDMRLGRAMPVVAAASLAGALALAAIPPLGAAWSKEEIVSATGHAAPWLALVTILAGALSAFYAARFQLLAFGRSERDGPRAGAAVRAAVVALAAVCLLLGLLWLPPGEHLAERLLPGELAKGKTWELAVSIVSVLAAAGLAWALARRRRLEPATAATGARAVLADWLGLPAAIRVAVTRPTLALATALAAFDDRVVDAGVRGAAAVGRGLSRVLSRVVELDVDRLVRALSRFAVATAGASKTADDAGVDRAVDGTARGVGAAGAGSRRLQTGAIPFYYVLVAAGLLVLALVLVIGGIP